jgi:hypothetical protein
MTGRTTCLAAIFASNILWSCAVDAQAASSDTVLFRETFEAGLSDRWLERGFPSIRRKNTFSLAVEANGNRYLKVDSDRSTSGKGIWLRFDPRSCPTIGWRWRIANVIADADLQRKEGDDSAAKLYVVLDGQSGWNPLDKRLLIYVWDNRLPAQTILPNAWEPEKARMLVLESGDDRVGQWVAERIDVLRDYARAFPGESPRDIEALVFMADTDNTSSQVSSGFDDLEIRCVTQPTDAPPR